MVKLTVLYGPPTDPEAFELYYAETHLPLVAKMPSVVRTEASRVVGTPDGSEAPYYRIFELWFEDEQTLGATLGSPEGQATVADIPNYATGGVTVVISQIG
jgi:uncharacterized protein (TIGR02118 family)